jgi:hypothetical protein
MCALPAWAGLELRDVRVTEGSAGPVRTEPLTAYPHDELTFRFTARGVKTTAGKASLDITLRLLRGTTELHKHTQPLTGLLALGGEQLAGQVELKLAGDIAPGEYTVNVSVTDKLDEHTVHFERPLTVKKASFALLYPRFSVDPKGDYPTTLAGHPGQALYLRTKCIGFDNLNKKVDVQFQLQLYDANGNELLAEPLTAQALSEDGENASKIDVLTFRGQLLLNRPGKFKLALTATDRQGRQSTTWSHDFTVAAKD